MIVFGLNNRIDQATLTSTASYAATLPLANIQTPQLSTPARTTSDAEFTMTVDLTSVAARSIGCIAIAGHNLSRTATLQIVTKQGSTTVNDSGVLSPWPYLPDTHPHWRKHTFSYAIIDSERITDLPSTFIYFLPDNVEGNKVLITITDTSNPDNYIEIGRLFVGEQLAPDMAEDWGQLNYGFNDLVDLVKTKTGAKYAYRYAIQRTANVAVNNLTTAEALGGLTDAQRKAGLTGEIILADTVPTYQDISGVNAVDSYWFAKALMGTFSDLDKFSFPYHGAAALALSVEEVVA